MFTSQSYKALPDDELPTYSKHALNMSAHGRDEVPNDQPGLEQPGENDDAGNEKRHDNLKKTLTLGVCVFWFGCLIAAAVVLLKNLGKLEKNCTEPLGLAAWSTLNYCIGSLCLIGLQAIYERKLSECDPFGLWCWFWTIVSRVTPPLFAVAAVALSLIFSSFCASSKRNDACTPPLRTQPGQGSF